MKAYSQLEEMLMDDYYETPQAEYYDAKGAAAFLKLTVARMRTLINRGSLKPIKINGEINFRAEDLAVLLTAQ
jgi:hypothetical protein